MLHLKIQDLYEKRELYTKKCVSKIKEAKKEWDQMDDFGITYSLDYQDLKETYESEFVEYVREIGKERKYGKNNIAVNRIN